MKITCHTGLWYFEFSWYCSTVNQQIALYDLNCGPGIHGFRHIAIISSSSLTRNLITCYCRIYVTNRRLKVQKYGIRIRESIPSSSCRVGSMDLPDSLSPPVSIVYCSWEVFKSISCTGTEQFYIGSSWSCCLFSSFWRGPGVYDAYEFVLTSPVVSRMSSSSNLDSFRDQW